MSSHLWPNFFRVKNKRLQEDWHILSPLDSKENKLVHPKGNQPWIFTGRTDAEAKAPILWPPDVKSWLTGKDPDARKDWRQEKGMTEDEMVGWHHWLDGHEFEQTTGDGEAQGSLVCCSLWVSKSQTQLSNWTTTQVRPTQSRAEFSKAEPATGMVPSQALQVQGEGVWAHRGPWNV